MSLLRLWGIASLVAALSISAGSARACQASWYGAESGPRTANGQRFNPEHPSVAHPYLPLNSWVRVTITRTGAAAVLQVTDRGPAARLHRCLDLSRGAARLLDVVGLADVSVTPVGSAGARAGRVRREPHRHGRRRRHHHHHRSE